MLALPIIEMQMTENVSDCQPINTERKLGLNRRETGWFDLTVEYDIARVIEVSTRGTFL